MAAGPGGYPERLPSYEERLPGYDQMDGRPPYEEDSHQGYGDEGPRSYMEDGLMPNDARLLQAPPDHYPGNGRLSPDDGCRFMTVFCLSLLIYRNKCFSTELAQLAQFAVCSA